jgi:hypothetical protein
MSGFIKDALLHRYFSQVGTGLITIWDTLIAPTPMKSSLPWTNRKWRLIAIWSMNLICFTSQLWQGVLCAVGTGPELMTTYCRVSKPNSSYQRLAVLPVGRYALCVFSHLMSFESFLFHQ